MLKKWLTQFNEEWNDWEQSSEVVTWTGQDGWNGGGSGSNQQLNYLFTRQPTKSGNAINGREALAISAFYAGVRMIAEDIAKLQLNIWTLDERGNRVLANHHNLFRVISQSPDGQRTSGVFWETIIAWSLVWGNGYAIIDRDPANGMIRSLQLVHPNRVVIKLEDGIQFYIIAPDENFDTAEIERVGQKVEADRVFHLHGVGDSNGGWPIANFAKESLGITLATQTLQSNFFSNGMNLGGTLETAEKMEKQHRDGMAAEMSARFSGSNNAKKWLVTDKGLKVNPFNMKSTDAELLETRRFQIEEVARWLRIPLHKLNILESNATFNNIEQENLKYVTETLGAWMERIQDLIEFKLLKFSPRFFVEFDRKPLVMADSKTRAEYWKELTFMGAATPNDAASDLGLSVYPAGNKHVMQAQMTPVNQLGESATPADKSNESTTNDDNEPDDARIDDESQSPPENKNEIKFDLENHIFGRYQNMFIPYVQKVIDFEIKDQTNRDKLVSSGKELDPQKTKLFYQRLAIQLTESIEPILTDQKINLPDNFIEHWTAWQDCPNWKESKAEFIVSDLLQYATGLRDIEAGIYTIENSDISIKKYKDGVIREIVS